MFAPDSYFPRSLIQRRHFVDPDGTNAISQNAGSPTTEEKANPKTKPSNATSFGALPLTQKWRKHVRVGEDQRVPVTAESFVSYG